MRLALGRQGPLGTCLLLSLNETRSLFAWKFGERDATRRTPEFQNPPLDCFNFASTLQSNPTPIALGRT